MRSIVALVFIALIVVSSAKQSKKHRRNNDKCKNSLNAWSEITIDNKKQTVTIKFINNKMCPVIKNRKKKSKKRLGYDQTFEEKRRSRKNKMKKLEQGEDETNKQKSPPHIVFIVSDDQGWNDVGWHNQEIKTPNLDKLAKNGVILGNSYVQPVCTPSRAAFLTGKYPHRLGLQWLVIQWPDPKFLPKNVTLLPEKLKEIGYKTHIVGKWHLGQCNRDLIPTARGFDSFFGILGGGADYFDRTFVGVYDFWKNDEIFYPPKGSYNTDLFTEKAVEIIESNDPETSPLFLYLPYTSPHFPLQVPKVYKNLYPDIADDDRKTYSGMVSSLDDGVGKIVDALERNKYMDNTIIIFLSDNGGDSRFGSSNEPLRGNKGNLWEGASKTVGFVYGHKSLITGGCIHNGMIHAVDWYSTILNIASHPDAESTDIDGISQWKFIQKCNGSGRKEFVYGLDDDVSKTAAIRVGKYKLITGDPHVFTYEVTPQSVVATPVDPNSTEVRLYDLLSDPYETNNLASAKPKMVQRLKKKLDKYREKSVPAQNPPLVSSTLAAPNGVHTLGWC